MNTYRIIDLQTNEVVVENQTLDDLVIFANELYWQDDVDFKNATFNMVKKAILGCDYGVDKYIK